MAPVPNFAPKNILAGTSDLPTNLQVNSSFRIEFIEHSKQSFPSIRITERKTDNPYTYSVFISVFRTTENDIGFGEGASVRKCKEGHVKVIFCVKNICRK